jgi:hypothetical protein
MVLMVEGKLGERADRRRRSQHARSSALAGPAAMEAPPSQQSRILSRRSQSHTSGARWGHLSE